MVTVKFRRMPDRQVMITVEAIIYCTRMECAMPTLFFLKENDEVIKGLGLPIDIKEGHVTASLTQIGYDQCDIQLGM